MVREQAAALPAESTISASPNEGTVVPTTEFLDETKYPAGRIGLSQLYLPTGLPSFARKPKLASTLVKAPRFKSVDFPSVASSVLHSHPRFCAAA